MHRQGDTILADYAYTYEDSDDTIVYTTDAADPATGLTAPSGLWMLPVHDTSTITSALAASTYADLSSITSMESSDGTVSYTYDPTGQLLSATYTSEQSDEVYTYDANGNRTTDGYVTGADNRLLSDGTYCYLYDAEGNRTTRFIDVNQNTLLDAGDTDVTEYSWDNRSRLIKVIDRAVANGPITQTVDYLYDTEDRWIGKDVDLDGDGVIDQMVRFAYNGTQIILQFEGDSSNDLTVSDLTHRYTWDPSVIDHLMADEQVTNPQTPGDVILPLTDHLGTVRDLATYDPATYTTTIATHRVYDSYGTLLTESGSIDCLFSFTGRPFDNATDLQNNWHRWYDTITARWMSQDPIGFNGKDTNTYRYVANSPANATDPNGLVVVRVEEYGPWTYDMSCSTYDDFGRFAEIYVMKRRYPNGVIKKVYYEHFASQKEAEEWEKANCFSAEQRVSIQQLEGIEKSLVTHCLGHANAEKDLVKLLNAFYDTPMVIGPGGMCKGWVKDFMAKLPEKFLELEVVPWEAIQVKPNWLVGGLSATMRFFGDTYCVAGHYSVKVTFPDKYEMYFDDGWAGTGGMYSYHKGPIPEPLAELVGGGPFSVR